MKYYPLPVVRVILTNERDEILFLKRANEKYEPGKWCLPGGKVEYGQTLEDACKDEVKQETDLDISNLERLFYKEDLPSKKYKLHCIDFYYAAQYKGEVKINDESSEYAWVHPAKFKDIEIAFNQREALEKIVK
ncbi:NUDIX hydrolase [Candidatus Pacearchaeota archaeon]|nr:NUDIX hydrolase [Candidatus Pacearchaeota archaeon]